MKIETTMQLSQLPEFPRGSFIPEQLVCLCALLNETTYRNTSDVPPEVWRRLVEKARIQCLMA